MTWRKSYGNVTQSACVLGFLFGIIFFIVGYLLPQFIDFYREMGSQLPPPTVVLVSIPRLVWFSLGVLFPIGAIVAGVHWRHVQLSRHVHALIDIIGFCSAAAVGLFIIMALYMPLIVTMGLRE